MAPIMACSEMLQIKLKCDGTDRFKQNYNTAIPNSVPPSISSQSNYAPSIVAPSIPSSPPPSFHTHSSPGTPRPTHSIRTSHSNPSYVELWGVAPSTVGGSAPTEIGGIGTSNDALATIAGLRTRVEWLEESLGRLLIEKDAARLSASASGSGSGSGQDGCENDSVLGKHRNNCCVAFTDASPDLERAVARGQNCCVTFKSSKADKQKLGGPALQIVRIIFAVLAVVLIINVTQAVAGRRERVGPPPPAMQDGDGVVGILVDEKA